MENAFHSGKQNGFRKDDTRAGFRAEQGMHSLREVNWWGWSDQIKRKRIRDGSQSDSF